MSIVTLNDLSQAIAMRLHIDMEQAKKLAHIVIDFFGYEDRIVDNVLNPEERRLFYILESLGILRTDRERTILYNGNEWRTHYWQLEKKSILHDSNRKHLKKRVDREREAYETLYANVPKDMWTSSRKI